MMNTVHASRRRLLAGATLLALPGWVRAHHGWSSFDQERPIYLAGKARTVAWRNPHAELELELAENLALPADLKQRALPRQSAAVDGAALLAKAQLPARRDRRWQVELAPLTRMQAWGVAEIKPGDALELLGFTFAGERGEAVLRAEFLFAQGRVFGLRSAPV